MIVDFFKNLFSGISDVLTFDLDNADPIEIDSIVSSVGMNFIFVALILTIVFVLLAAIPRYTFTLSFMNDILLRRIIFFIGLGFTLYVLYVANTTVKSLCEARNDKDIAWDNFSPLISMHFYISLAIYPVLFWLVAFVFNTLLHRRKLNTIFRSNNKVFGLI
ncbi:MAG: hypothetical protein RLZZ60_43 [Bacteroidota bacterium]|jgi:hypothetical protein